MKEFFKNQSTGFYLSIASIIIALIALLIYTLNGKSTYYNDYNSTILNYTLIAVGVEIVFLVLVLTIGEKRWLDIFYVVPPILFGIAAVTFISFRVQSAGIILGSELEKGNVAASNALMQAFIGIGLYFLAMITSFVKSFKAQLKQ
ncbi:MAG: hypothetical protein K0B14_01505 [Anaerolineaceae bacterium]|nr:hypothetical protein [Anaerolineaceae bacterium]